MARRDVGHVPHAKGRSIRTTSLVGARLRHHAAMRIVITGGAGYIGSQLTGALLTDGHEVTALVGFPACQAAGKETSYRFNYTATRRVFDAAEKASVERFIFASTHSNYGIAQDSLLVTEE